MKKSKITIDQETLRKIKRGHARQMKKEQGAFDGRFKTRADKDKSKYSRKRKHKKVDY
jgi:hypothetical protein